MSEKTELELAKQKLQNSKDPAEREQAQQKLNELNELSAAIRRLSKPAVTAMQPVRPVPKQGLKLSRPKANMKPGSTTTKSVTCTRTPTGR